MNILQVALKERGIDKLLDEAREELKDSDSTYMGKKKCEFELTTWLNLEG